MADSNSVGGCQNQCSNSVPRKVFLVESLSYEAMGAKDWSATELGLRRQAVGDLNPASARTRCLVSGMFTSSRRCY